ncbi:hypothetical protein JHK82_056191 [Glycine max]|nr:hypothetical protein JHK82_056191 [Glycine max]
MARQLKEMRVVKSGEEFGIGSLVFVLCVTLSLLTTIIFFCADGVPKNSKKASQDNNYGGSACAAGCGGGCGG